MQIPKFSIIVPIYNIQPYLCQCIDSIINQSFADFELILVDDGSNDGSSIICDNYAEKDNRILVIHKKNEGLVNARKTGARASKGMYIVCVDGDDWISLDYLSDSNSIILNHNPDMISFGFFEAKKSGNKERQYRLEGLFDRDKIEKEIFPELIYNDRSERFPNNIWAKVFRRDIYYPSQMSVNDQIKIGEDTACVVPCVTACNSLFISRKCEYYYRYNDQAMTKALKPLLWNGPKLIDDHLIKSLSASGYLFDSQIAMRTIHAVFNVAVSQYYQNEAGFKTNQMVKTNLNEKYITEALDKTGFLEVKHIIMRLAVKYKLTFLFYLYAAYRKRRVS